MFLKGIHVQNYLMFIFAINTLEYVKTKFSFLDFQLRWVDFVVHLVTLPKLLIVFQLVRAITFNVLRTLNSARLSCVTSLSAVFTLRNA